MSRFLCIADWHIRSDNPICRTDNFQQTQKKCLLELVEIYKNNNCDAILHAGDIFHKAKPSRAQELENMLYDIFKGIPIYFVMGNHDLQHHNIENADKGSIGVISRFENWNNKSDWCHVHMFNYGQTIYFDENKIGLRICLIHKYIAKNEVPFFIKDGLTAEELLDKYPHYDVFITGDNHEGFIFEKDNRYVINPGRLNRQEVDTKNYQPRCYILDTEKKSVETIYLNSDTDLDAITDEHISVNKEREERITAFVETIKKQGNISLSFEDNLKDFLKKNSVNKRTQKIIEELMYDNKSN